MISTPNMQIKPLLKINTTNLKGLLFLGKLQIESPLSCLLFESQHKLHELKRCVHRSTDPKFTHLIGLYGAVFAYCLRAGVLWVNFNMLMIHYCGYNGECEAKSRPYRRQGAPITATHQLIIICPANNKFQFSTTYHKLLPIIARVSTATKHVCDARFSR